MTITHLLFADDSLIFLKALTRDCINLKAIFDYYDSTSSQIFNYKKSSMFFLASMKAGHISTIKNIFQLNVVDQHERYLGLLSMVGKKKRSFFNDTKLKILNKMSSWQSKCFLSGGWEILLKIMAETLPAFVMSVFKIPIWLCENIQKVVARFWWGFKRDKKSIN